MAILAELQSDHPFVVFDEIENGINPELVEFVLNALITARPAGPRHDSQPVDPELPER